MKILISNFIWQTEGKTNDISGQKGHLCFHIVVDSMPYNHGWKNQNSFCICAAFQTRNKQFALLSSIRSSELEAKEHWPIGACSLRCPVWTSVLLQEQNKIPGPPCWQKQADSWLIKSYRCVTFMSTWIIKTVWYFYQAPLLCNTTGHSLLLLFGS